MNFRLIGFVVGIFLFALGVMMAVPAAVDAAAGNEDWRVFAGSGLFTGMTGGLLCLATRGEKLVPGIRDSFLLTSLAWTVVSLFAAAPLFFSSRSLGVTDALFETVSGLTTTGATVLSHLDAMPPGLLLWRSLLQWIGGIGIIVLAVAVLPYLGAGGMRLFHTESSDRSERPMARLKPLAGTISLVYLGLTLACALAYYAAGMTLFESVNHALTTLSTGGYSTSDQSIGHFAAPAVQWVGIVFMILAGLPFVLYIRALKGERGALWRDGQVRLFFRFLLVSVLVFTVWFWAAREEPFAGALLHVAFHITSILTTTGYSTVDYSQWGTLAFETVFFLTFVGGCSGSTSGGIKMFRFEVMFNLIGIQMKRLIHPHIVLSPKYNGKPIDEGTVQSVMTFFVLYLLSVALLALALSALGLDVVTSASGAATAIANVGPGLGAVIGPGGTFAPLPDAAKWLLMFGMLLGRLELFTVLILFTPQFWRK
ncbi:MAG: TrkH family potassium uptake protein [Nitrospinales bacterium]